MPNEFNPTAAPGIPYRFPWMSVYTPVIPCTFDGSLSLLEMCGKMLRALNEVISVTNDTQADMVQLASYVAQQVANMYEIINTHDSTTLADAKAYTDSAITSLRSYVDTQDNAKLLAAQQYTDNAIATLRTYVDAQLAGKQDTLTFDTTPTSGSTNPCTSGGIFAAINALPQATIYTMQLVDRTLTTNVGIASILIAAQRNPGQAIFIRYDHDNGEKEWFWLYDCSADGNTLSFISRYSLLTGNAAQARWTISTIFDTQPTLNSSNYVSSGSLFGIINNLQGAQVLNIEVDLVSGSYSSILTYAQIRSFITAVDKAFPFVGVYDEDELERVAILYYSHEEQDGGLIFTQLAPGAGGQLQLKLLPNNTWTEITT